MSKSSNKEYRNVFTLGEVETWSMIRCLYSFILLCLCLFGKLVKDSTMHFLSSLAKHSLCKKTIITVCKSFTDSGFKIESKHSSGEGSYFLRTVK